MTTTDLTGTAGHGRGSLKKIKDETKFFPHQLVGVRTLARKTSFLLADEMGGGKAQPVGTLVLTPEGWRPIGALEPGDVICRPSGGVQRVVAVHPQGVIDVARLRFSDGASVLASWDHRWTVSDTGWWDPKAGPPPDTDAPSWQTLTTREIYTNGLERGGHPRWEVPLARPVHTEGKWHDHLDPFTVGFIIAGGLAFESKTPNPKWIRVREGRLEPARMLRIFGARVVYRNDGHAYVEPTGHRPDALKDYLSELAKIGVDTATSKRRWPEAIRFARVDDRFRFLLGIIAAVGTVDPAHGGRFGLDMHQLTTESVRNGIVELVQLLGGLAVKGDKGWIGLWWPTPLRLWSGALVTTARPTRSITGIGPAGRAECVCITVDDPEGLYVTEHGIVTHNSLQALAVAAIDFELGTARKVLIVCPSTLKDNWAAEIEEHTRFNAIVTPTPGTPKSRQKVLEQFRTDPEVDICIMHYEQVKGHLEDVNAANVDIVIFDEAHYIKGHKSQRTKACHKIAAKRAFLLTGSPMLNSPHELWSLLHRINPQEFPRYWTFVQRFCVFGGYKDKEIVGVKNQIELLEILDRYMLRRKKSEMVKLPEKNFVPVIVPLSPLQRKLYEEAESELRLEIPDEPEPLELENAMVKTLKLKQITGTPATLGFPDESTKLDRCMEITQELIDNGEKVVIWTQFRGVLEAVERRLREAKIPVWSLHGDVPGAKRVPLVHDWRDSQRPGAMLAMLQVGGVGLDFTAASNMIFIDKLYTPAMNDQAVDRCHRLSMDRSKPVTIYELRAAKTVEDRVEKILAKKRKMNDEVIDNTQFRKMVIAALHGDE